MVSPSQNQTSYSPPDPSLEELIDEVKSMVVLTGAGVSAESGVPTFRGKDGLWNNFRPEELATPEAFLRDPELVWKWYDWRRGIIGACHPNPAHTGIAELETMIDDFLLVTQNVDGLHKRAGSRNMVEIHGNIWGIRCVRCGGVGEEETTVPMRTIPPICGVCGSLLRPDVVWFGESLDSKDLERAWVGAGNCDLMIVVGTSALVYPAAGLPQHASDCGAKIIEINIEPTPVTRIATKSLFGPASTGVTTVVGAFRSLFL